MDSAELRELQQPLKDAYREDPEKAVITLRARGQLDDGVSCSVETGRALAVAGSGPSGWPSTWTPTRAPNRSRR
jgi:hypothetical protein